MKPLDILRLVCAIILAAAALAILLSGNCEKARPDQTVLPGECR